MTVTDDDGDSGSDTITVTVSNVDPVAANLVVTVNSVTGVATATFDYSDAGWADTHTATFRWSVDDVTTPGVVTQTPGSNVDPGPVTGSVVGTHMLPAGCHTLIVTATITDDDGGDDTISTTSSSVDVFAAAFQAPIKGNERNIAKYGNVVPVKVQLTSSYTGQAVTTPVLHITIATGDDNLDPANVEEITATSVSNADTGTQMRINGNGYIYNLSTKSMKVGQEYPIRIRVGTPTGPIILRALFQPKR